MPGTGTSTLPDAPAVIAMDGKPFAPVGEPTTDANGQPRRTYRKELIRAGTFVTNANQQFTVTPDVLDHWAATFSRMDAAGVKVPVPVGHTERDEANRGWVRGMERDGDSLYATIELIGEDAIKMASRTDVSIFSPLTIKDGKGVEYVRPISHVALTSEPVVAGLGAFEVVASLGQKWNNVPVLRLAQGATNMDEFLKELAAAVGLTITDTMSEDEIKGAIKAKVGVLDKKAEQADKAEEEKAAAVEQAVAAARTKWEADKGAGTKVDPLNVRFAGDAMETELNAVAADGHITPACRDGIAAALIGKDRAAIAASRSSEELAGRMDTFKSLVAALRKNTVKELAEKTGQQVIAMSRTLPGTAQKDASLTENMQKMAGTAA